MMQKILIIDDDAAIGDLEQEVLELEATACCGPIPGRRRCCF